MEHTQENKLQLPKTVSKAPCRPKAPRTCLFQDQEITPLVLPPRLFGNLPQPGSHHDQVASHTAANSKPTPACSIRPKPMFCTVPPHRHKAGDQAQAPPLTLPQGTLQALVRSSSGIQSTVSASASSSNSHVCASMHRAKTTPDRGCKRF